MLNRDRFREEWVSLFVFMIAVIVPSFWVLLRPKTELQAALGTGIASLVTGAIGWLFLRREGVSMSDVGLGRCAWTEGLALFAGWWVLVTLVDLIGQGVTSLAGATLVAMWGYRRWKIRRVSLS